MLDFIKDISPTQWVLISIGITLMVASLSDRLIEFFPILKIDKNVKPNVAPEEETDLTSLVAKWEVLSDACEDAGLLDAHEKLQEVFPMLVEVYTPRGK